MNWKIAAFRGMEVKVHYYGSLTEAAGCEQELIESVNLDSAKDLLDLLKERYHEFSRLPIILFAENQRLLDDDRLSENLHIDCMPPFSGG